eukprot:scaffold48012_cov65-Cyclotella_meneghiniana.AAC.1
MLIMIMLMRLLLYRWEVLFARDSQFEDDDDDLEADKIYAVINERMSNKRKRNNNDNYNINC